MEKITNEQLRALNAILANKGLMAQKADLIYSFTGGRTTHSSELTLNEAREAISLLSKDFVISAKEASMQKMQRHIIAMAHEIGWIEKTRIVAEDGSVKFANNYTKLNEWMDKYSLRKKQLKQYTYEELPGLVTQFQNGPYKFYINKH